MPFVPVNKSYGSNGPPLSSYLPPGAINSMLLGRLDIPGGLYSGTRSPLASIGGYGGLSYGFGSPVTSSYGGSLGPSYVSSPSKVGRKYGALGLTPISEHSTAHQRVSRPPKFNHINAYSKPLDVAATPRRPASNRFATFNTEDIDVTTPRRPSRDESATETPKPEADNADDENFATPREISRDRDKTFGTIRRNRTVIRIQTQHLKENPYLVTEEKPVKKPKKTTGEKLKEKWAIQSKKKKHSGYRKPSLTDIQAQQEILRREIEARQAALMQRRAERAASITSDSTESGDGLTKSQEEDFFNNPEKVPRRKSTQKFLLVRQMSQENVPCLIGGVGEGGLLSPDVIPIPISRSGSTAGLLPVDLAIVIPEEEPVVLLNGSSNAVVLDEALEGDIDDDDDDEIDFWATPALRSKRSTLVIRNYFKPIPTAEEIIALDSSDVQSIHEEDEENCDLEIESIMTAGQAAEKQKKNAEKELLQEMSEIFAGAKPVETEQNKESSSSTAEVDERKAKTVKKVKKNKQSDTKNNLAVPSTTSTPDTNEETKSLEPQKTQADAAKEQVQQQATVATQSTTIQPSCAEKQMPDSNAETTDKVKTKPKPFKLPSSSDVKDSPDTSPSKIAGKSALFSKFETKADSPSPKNTPVLPRKPEFIKAKSPGSPRTETPPRQKSQTPESPRPAFVKAKSPGSPKVSIPPVATLPEVPKLEEAAVIIAESENKQSDETQKSDVKPPVSGKDAAAANKSEAVKGEGAAKDKVAKTPDATKPGDTAKAESAVSSKVKQNDKLESPDPPKGKPSDAAKPKPDPLAELKLKAAAKRKQLTDPPVPGKSQVTETDKPKLGSPAPENSKLKDAEKPKVGSPVPDKSKLIHTEKPTVGSPGSENPKLIENEKPKLGSPAPDKPKLIENEKSKLGSPAPLKSKLAENLRAKTESPVPASAKANDLSKVNSESSVIKPSKQVRPIEDNKTAVPSKPEEVKKPEPISPKSPETKPTEPSNFDKTDSPKPESPALQKPKAITTKRTDSPARPAAKELVKIKDKLEKDKKAEDNSSGKVHNTANKTKAVTSTEKTTPPEVAKIAAAPKPELTNKTSTTITGTVSTTTRNEDKEVSPLKASQSNLVPLTNKTNGPRTDQSSLPVLSESSFSASSSSSLPNQVEPPYTDNEQSKIFSSVGSSPQTDNDNINKLPPKPTAEKPKLSEDKKISPKDKAKSKKNVIGLQNRLNSREEKRNKSLESSDSSESIVQLKTSVIFASEEPEPEDKNHTTNITGSQTQIESEDPVKMKTGRAKVINKKTARSAVPDAAKSNVTADTATAVTEKVTEITSLSQQTVQVTTEPASQVQIINEINKTETTIISETETVIESAMTTSTTVLPNPIVQEIIRESQNRNSSESSGSADGDSPPLTPKSSGRDGSSSTTSSSTLSAGTSGSSRRMPSPPSEESDEDQETIARRICPTKTRPKFRRYEVDDFQFLKVLGKGSFGKVLLAELKGTDCYFAVKCLKKDVVLEDDDVECTMIERKVLLMGSKHPYLCHLLCTFQTESHLFFVMEYLNGGDLMFHIQQTGRFTEDRARFYAAEIVSGLKFLHKKGIIYRDLKLDNVLLDFEGHVRIADFGMCKLQIYLDRTADTFCGTPDYMAPEIIKGLKYNQCVDWWAFGILLYEMLIGQSPFSGCDEDELFWSICNESVRYPRFLSRESKKILEQLLEKDASKRLGTPGNPHGEVKEQPFFAPINWDKLERRELEPPFKPKLKHSLDVQYFDTTFTKEAPRLTPVDKEILRSMDQTQFEGFSYTNPHTTD